MDPTINPTNGAAAFNQPQAKASAQNDTISWNERPTPENMPTSNPEHPKHVPTLTAEGELPKGHAKEHKRYQDVLAYEDKWIGWDGPVWCSRYGRFENQEDAAADDGYKIKGGAPHESEFSFTLQVQCE